MFDINVDDVWRSCRVFGAHNVARGSGPSPTPARSPPQIVNRPQWQPAYNASKAAVRR